MSFCLSSAPTLFLPLSPTNDLSILNMETKCGPLGQCHTKLRKTVLTNKASTVSHGRRCLPKWSLLALALLLCRGDDTDKVKLFLLHSSIYFLAFFSPVLYWDYSNELLLQRCSCLWVTVKINISLER